MAYAPELESVEVRQCGGGLEVVCPAQHWRAFSASLDHAVGLLMHVGQRPRVACDAMSRMALRRGLAGLFLEEDDEFLEEALWAFVAK